MKQNDIAVPVKLWALFCTIVSVSLTSNEALTFVLVLTGFAYLAIQHNWRALRSFFLFYVVLALLLYLIRYQGLRLVLFSEFYVLMFWNLFAVFIVGWDLITTPPGELSAFMSRIHIPTAGILGLLVMFRFFPTMKAEIKSVYLSMRNRGLVAFSQFLSHPISSCEYVLVPLLLRCLQLSDQLSVSAVARGAEAAGRRSSYYEKGMQTKDWLFLVLWSVVTFSVLFFGGMSI